MAEILPNVIKINNYNEIFDSTKKLINKDLNSNDYEIELINYIAASMDVSFPQKFTGYEKKSEELLKEQNDRFIKEIYYALKKFDMQIIEKEFDRKNFKTIEIKSNTNLYFEKLFLEYSFEYINKYEKIIVTEIIINKKIITILTTPDIDGDDKKISFFDEPINISFDDEEVYKKILDLFKTKYNAVKVKKICKHNFLANNFKHFQSDDSKREIFEETEIDLTIELDQIFNQFSKGHKYNVKKR